MNVPFLYTIVLKRKEYFCCKLGATPITNLGAGCTSKGTFITGYEIKTIFVSKGEHTASSGTTYTFGGGSVSIGPVGVSF